MPGRLGGSAHETLAARNGRSHVSGSAAVGLFDAAGADRAVRAADHAGHADRNRRDGGVRNGGSALRAALAETAAPASLQLATAHGYRNVPVTDVLFLERILRKTRVVLTDGEELVTAAPAALLEAVPDGVFLRCHQSYWANFSHITAMEKDEFVLTGGLRVPISRSYRSAARSAFFANLRGEEG